MEIDLTKAMGWRPRTGDVDRVDHDPAVEIDLTKAMGWLTGMGHGAWGFVRNDEILNKVAFCR